ncbi:hypothetical protein GCM10010178_80030 [Lentzea flava]|uniref:Uncharacterized protein n=1 Tax=Lentzea flava TaxID=103732 RepID=A0ABQ2VAS6_9PSEU|nr:hypothetical protein GCM10010178_80030 [Lentzea flava]
MRVRRTRRGCELRVLDSAGGSVHWRCTPTVAMSFFRSPASLSTSRLGDAEAAGDVIAQVVTDAVGVSHGHGEQVLRFVRITVTGLLGDGPTVLPRQVREQCQQERPGSAPGLGNLSTIVPSSRLGAITVAKFSMKAVAEPS